MALFEKGDSKHFFFFLRPHFGKSQRPFFSFLWHLSGWILGLGITIWRCDGDIKPEEAWYPYVQDKTRSYMTLWLFLVNWSSDSHQFFFWSALRSWGFPGEVWELKKLKNPGTCVPVNRISMSKLHSKAEESQGCSTTLGTSWGFWETWTQMSGILGAEENSERPIFWWVPGTRVVREDYSEMAVRGEAPIF